MKATQKQIYFLEILDFAFTIIFRLIIFTQLKIILFYSVLFDKFTLCGLKIQSQAPYVDYFKFCTYPACQKSLALFLFTLRVSQFYNSGSGLMSSVIFRSWFGISVISSPQICSFIQGWAVVANIFCLSLLSHAMDLIEVSVMLMLLLWALPVSYPYPLSGL